MGPADPNPTHPAPRVYFAHVLAPQTALDRVWRRLADLVRRAWEPGSVARLGQRHALLQKLASGLAHAHTHSVCIANRIT